MRRLAAADRDFQVIESPSAELCAEVAALAPTNPFYTPTYVACRCAGGERSYLLIARPGPDEVDCCMAFVRSGRIQRVGEILSMPALRAPEPFWTGFRDWADRAGVSRLFVGSFASPACAIPSLWEESWRKARVEYVLDLQTAEFWKKVRKGHLSNIKKAAKAGVEMRVSSDCQACQSHAALINASMSRRAERGEAVSANASVDRYWPLIESGAGRIYQAVIDDEVVSSNLVLMAENGGYNHTQGTSAEGTRLGAAHFLIHALATALRDEGMSTFNLGGTDQINSGLERFKDGFGASLRKVELESAEFFIRGRVQSLLRRMVDRVTG